MSDLTRLSRREREIMNVLFSKQKATVHEVCSALHNPPTPMAVRRMLAILLEKGLVKRQKQGREHVYLPKHSRRRAGLAALRQVLKTFFDGSVGTALATHLEQSAADLSDEEVERLRQLIRDLNEKRGDS